MYWLPEDIWNPHRIWLRTFFRLRLLSIQSHEEVIAFLKGYENEIKAIKDEALRLCWWMRGSISYDEAMQLSQVDREIINKIVKDNVEAGKKAGIPVF